jgi:hypothetical protein
VVLNDKIRKSGRGFGFVERARSQLGAPSVIAEVCKQVEKAEMNGGVFFSLCFFGDSSPFLLHRSGIISSSANNDALAAGVGRDVLFLIGRAAARLIIVTTSGSTAVKLDAITRAGDTVAFASAAQR